MHIWLLGASPPDPHRGSAPGSHWGLPSLRPPVPTVPPNPGYATGTFLILILVLSNTSNVIVQNYELSNINVSAGMSV